MILIRTDKGSRKGACSMLWGANELVRHFWKVTWQQNQQSLENVYTISCSDFPSKICTKKIAGYAQRFRGRNVYDFLHS